ncbi:MAG: transcriptional repressor LexA [Gemmataceae bacterium]|nr:transcriptional repressor LexA [Gemmataceae bacterium]
MNQEFGQTTQRQKEIFIFIRDKIETRGYGPTVREIGLAFGIKSPNGVMCHLKALEKKGLILRESFSARAIQIINPRKGKKGLPYLGAVAAGSPIASVAQEDTLDLESLFSGDNHYVLQVRGYSMIEDNIQDGDYIVVRKQEIAANGERVVAMIDNEVTLKRFIQDRNQVRLEPCNSTMHPIIIQPGSETKILGVLAGVLRKC